MTPPGDERPARSSRRLRVLAVVAVGLGAVIAPTAVGASVGPNWIAVMTRIGSGIVTVATGLTVNRIARGPRNRP